MKARQNLSFVSQKTSTADTILVVPAGAGHQFLRGLMWGFNSLRDHPVLELCSPLLPPRKKKIFFHLQQPNSDFKLPRLHRSPVCLVSLNCRPAVLVISFHFCFQLGSSHYDIPLLYYVHSNFPSSPTNRTWALHFSASAALLSASSLSR